MQRFKSKGSILANKINCVVLCETKIILSGFKSKKRFYPPSSSRSYIEYDVNRGRGDGKRA